MKKQNGMIMYKGKSMLNGAPIQVIATGLANKSHNEKTGDMVQTWIMRSDMAPTEARKRGCDDAVCGNCPHRSGSCYVTLFQAPLTVHKASGKGAYGRGTPDVSGRMVRMGAYGDPTAAPFEVWEYMLEKAKGHTGYTHQWRTCDERFRDVIMASCDSEQDREAAKALGWRTFRVRTADEPLLPGEIACPASDEGGNRTTCERCGLCSGTNGKGKVDVAIIVHGIGAKKFRR